MIIPTPHPIRASGTGTPLRNAGAPVAAVNEVQSLTSTNTAGSAQLSFNGVQAVTATNYNDTAATIQAALQSLSNIGAGNVTCTGGPLGTAAVVITFGGTLAGQPQDLIVVGAGLTGGAATVTETTHGAPATHPEAATGALLIDTTNAELYQNKGAVGSPNWVKVDAEG